ncbi:MBL fold metallo-hydrolase [bacterium]|nr:MBL fold metallo-hydrolase [bacterium]
MDIYRLIVGEFETNCYILAAGNELIIIDPGAEAGVILKKLRKISGKVKYVINTHGHYDHTTANWAVKKEVLAPICIHEAERKIIDFRPDKYLREGDIFKAGDIELKVIHTPGHTPGSICLFGEDVVFTGDTLFLNGYGRTDLEFGSEFDMEQSLKRLDKLIKPGMRVYPGHGENFIKN